MAKNDQENKIDEIEQELIKKNEPEELNLRELDLNEPEELDLNEEEITNAENLVNVDVKTDETVKSKDSSNQLNKKYYFPSYNIRVDDYAKPNNKYIFIIRPFLISDQNDPNLKKLLMEFQVYTGQPGGEGKKLAFFKKDGQNLPPVASALLMASKGQSTTEIIKLINAIVNVTPDKIKQINEKGNDQELSEDLQELKDILQNTIQISLSFVSNKKYFEAKGKNKDVDNDKTTKKQGYLNIDVIADNNGISGVNLKLTDINKNNETVFSLKLSLDSLISLNNILQITTKMQNLIANNQAADIKESYDILINEFLKQYDNYLYKEQISQKTEFGVPKIGCEVPAVAIKTTKYNIKPDDTDKRIIAFNTTLYNFVRSPKDESPKRGYYEKFNYGYYGKVGINFRTTKINKAEQPVDITSSNPDQDDNKTASISRSTMLLDHADIAVLKTFFENLDFIPSPTDPNKKVIPIDSLHKAYTKTREYYNLWEKGIKPYTVVKFEDVFEEDESEQGTSALMLIDLTKKGEKGKDKRFNIMAPPITFFGNNKTNCPHLLIEFDGNRFFVEANDVEKIKNAFPAIEQSNNLLKYGIVETIAITKGTDNVTYSTKPYDDPIKSLFATRFLPPPKSKAEMNNIPTIKKVKKNTSESIVNTTEKHNDTPDNTNIELGYQTSGPSL